MKKKIGIVVLCSNAYLPLGIRFVKRFAHFYKGSSQVMFYLFTDKNPSEYLPDHINYEWRELKNTNWVDGTNAKFTSILGVEDDYIFYFDADTNINEEFGDWFVGDIVGGQHFGDDNYMAKDKPFERNSRSMAYIPKNTKLKQTYYLGAFFGGKKDSIHNICSLLIQWQRKDKEWGFEPVWNDESYLNALFHFTRPKTIPFKDFPFAISDKGGMGETRNPNLDISELLKDLKIHKEKLIDIKHGKVVI